MILAEVLKRSVKYHFHDNKLFISIAKKEAFLGGMPQNTVPELHQVTLELQLALCVVVR